MGGNNMALTLTELENESLKLSTKERAELAEHLLESIDSGGENDSEKYWIEEAEKRYQAYRAGKIKGKPADRVFKDAYKKFK